MWLSKTFLTLLVVLSLYSNNFYCVDLHNFVRRSMFTVSQLLLVLFTYYLSFNHHWHIWINLQAIMQIQYSTIQFFEFLLKRRTKFNSWFLLTFQCLKINPIGRHYFTIGLFWKHDEAEKVTFRLFFSNSKLSLASEVKLYINHQAWEMLKVR